MQTFYASLAAFGAVLVSVVVGFQLGDQAGAERTWKEVERSGVYQRVPQGQRDFAPRRPLGAGHFAEEADPPGGGAWLKSPHPLGSKQ